MELEELEHFHLFLFQYDSVAYDLSETRSLKKYTVTTCITFLAWMYMIRKKLNV